MHRRHIAYLFAFVITGAAMPSQAEISFTEVSEDSGIDRSGETYGASWGDLDGDGYPDLFVSMHRFQPSLFLNDREGGFIDVAKQTFAWMNKPQADTHGGTWFDFDNDGDQDLFVGVGVGNPDQFLVNERGRLVDRTDELGMTMERWGGRLPVWMDYDGDGLPDVVMTQLGGIADLMRQLPGGGFEMRTGEVRMLCRPWQYAQQLDVTGDGRLDLVCPDSERYPHRIWNTLPAPWQNVTERIPAVETVADSVLADFDNNGLLDVFLLGGVQTHPSGVGLSADGRVLEARLMGATKGFDFVTGGEVTIEIYQEGFGLGRVRIGAGGAIPAESTITLDPADPAVAGMPADPGLTPILLIGFDPGAQRWTVRMRSRTEEGEQVWSEAYFVIRATQEISDVRTQGLWITDQAAAPTLLLNRGADFEDVTAAAGLDAPLECVSAAAGDFDNDMDMDLYLACRQATGNIENILYENRGDGTFALVAGAGGAEGPIGLAVSEGAGTAETVSLADYDLDGYLDLFVTNGLNLLPKHDKESTGGPLRLYRNDGGPNGWLQLDLVGTDSHREAVGARVEVSAGGVVQTRIKNGSYHRWSHDHTRMHFGLAQSEAADITIRWPSGLTETHADVPAGAVYRAVEGGDLSIVSAEGVAPYPCAWEPPIDPARDRGVFVVRNCVDETWQLHVADGGSATTLSYRGSVSSSAPFIRVTPRSIEIYDELELAPDRFDFVLNVRNGARDAIHFLPADGASVCISIDAPAETTVRYGPLARPAPRRFDPLTLGPCQGDEPQPPEPVRDSCGMPAYAPGTDAGIFLWRNCGSGEWQVRMTAGGGGQLRHGGRVDGILSGLSPIALEPDDVLRSAGAGLDYLMTVAGANQDGFRFTPLDLSKTCFAVDTDSVVHVGASARMVAAPFRLDTLTPCAP